MPPLIAREGWNLTGGIFVGTSGTHADNRGFFQELFRETGLPKEATPFGVRQVSRTMNRSGALRGLHVTDVPPGQAKYVTCLSGRAHDVVVDVRVGSPTFGEHVAIELTASNGRSIYVAQGMAHGYVALEDKTSILYLHDAEYLPERDKNIQALDEALEIDWPLKEHLRSPKDIAAPTLAESLRFDLLPTFASCTRDGL